MNLDERELAAIQQHRKRNNLDEITGVLGTVGGLIPDRYQPGNVWVRVPTSNGLSARRSVRAPAKYFKMKAGDPVQLEYDKRGRLRIAEPDADGDLSRGVDPVAQSQRDTSDSVPQSTLETLNLIAKGGYLVSLKGWNVIVNGLYREVSFPDIDLEPYLPSSGEMCYAAIFVLGDLLDTEITTSTPVSIYDLDLGPADVQECLDGATENSTPAWAVKLMGDMTALTMADIQTDGKDLRQTVNSRGPYKFTPTNTADAAGSLYDIAYDDSYFYLKTVAGWKRAALSTF